jgi:CRISPR/Cas system-associated exonuclease Cas4 (RecB family)
MENIYIRNLKKGMKMINEILNLYKKTGEVKARKSHYISELTVCSRQLQFKWMLTEIKADIESVGGLKMDIGTAIEDDMRKKIKAKRKEWHLQEQVQVRWKSPLLEYPISGKVDFLCRINGEKIGIELKTGYGRGITQMKTENKPKPAHLVQAYMYMKLLGLKKWYLIYIARDNAYPLEFVLDYRQGKFCVNGEPIREFHIMKIKRKLLQIEEACYWTGYLPKEYKAVIKDGKIKRQIQKTYSVLLPEGLWEEQYIYNEKTKKWEWHIKKHDKKIEIYKSDWQCNYCGWKDFCWIKEKQLSYGKIFFGEKELDL